MVGSASKYTPLINDRILTRLRNSPGLLDERGPSQEKPGVLQNLNKVNLNV